mmetsp:Transcript_1112/g.1597  ORF Transcript_1112/g.1597 Transcript_1112/m.1597 type:complete len:354 (-) Transcript_1112:111-1172(-)
MSRVLASSPVSSSVPSAFTIHSSLRSITPHYDSFILDQFGVLHDGKQCLEGADVCVNSLSSMGKKMVILSNTSSLSHVAMKKLPQLGLCPDLFDGVITSGEEASRYIRDNYGREGSIQKALFLTWKDQEENTRQFLKRCGNVVPADSVEEASLVIAHGSQIVQTPCSKNEIELGTYFEDGCMKDVLPLLEKCLEKKLPMVCANPDSIVKLSDGSIAHMPGKIAQAYEEIGGSCQSFGKPRVEHFESCLRMLAMDGNRNTITNTDDRHCTTNRVAHVGDSLHHDVAGANDAGIDSIFVMGGIHAKDIPGFSTKYWLTLNQNHNEMDLEAWRIPLKDLFEREGIFPTHVIPMFQL